MKFLFLSGYTVLIIPNEDGYTIEIPFQRVKITKVFVNLLTHERIVLISMTIDGREITIPVNRGDLVERQISRKLNGLGLNVS